MEKNRTADNLPLRDGDVPDDEQDWPPLWWMRIYYGGILLGLCLTIIGWLRNWS